MDFSYVFASIPVASRDDAAGWYGRLFGRPPDILPNENEAMWQLTGTASVYLVVDPLRAGNGVVTMRVDDLDAALAEARARGVVPGAIEVIPGAGRKGYVSDPDGNVVALVQLGSG